jgi:hypothetical protein
MAFDDAAGSVAAGASASGVKETGDRESHPASHMVPAETTANTIDLWSPVMPVALATSSQSSSSTRVIEAALRKILRGGINYPRTWRRRSQTPPPPYADGGGSDARTLQHRGHEAA